MIYQTPDSYWDLLRSIFVTLLKKLSSAIVLFCFFTRQFLQLCFKYASKQIIVKNGCSKYQKLFKILIRNIFQGMYCCAHVNATLTLIQHTVPTTPETKVYGRPLTVSKFKCILKMFDSIVQKHTNLWGFLGLHLLFFIMFGVWRQSSY